MAQGFKLDTKNEFEEFAKEFTDAVGVEMGRKALFAGQVLQGILQDSTSNILKKNPKGTLKRGWTVGPLQLSEKNFKVEVFNLVPYAMIHETGGVIRPKRVKALAVPNRDYRPIIKNGSPIAPREFDPGRTILKFYPAISPGRLRGYLVDKKTGQLAYTLMASVTIKATGYISKAIEEAEPHMVEILGDAVDLAFTRTK